MKRFSCVLVMGLLLIILSALTFSAFSQEENNKKGCMVYGYTFDSLGRVIYNVVVTIGSSTDSSGGGGYRIMNLPPGTYTIKASCKGYKDYTDTITIKPGQKELKKNVRLQEIKEPTPQQVTKCRIFGEIRNTLGWIIEEKVVISIAGKNVNATGGNYSIEGIPAGTHQITANRKGHKNFSKSITINPGQKTLKEDLFLEKIEKPQKPEEPEKPTGAKEGIVWGEVTYTKNFTIFKLEGVMVEIAGMKTYTNKDGEFSFEKVPTGEQTMTFRKSGFKTKTEQILVRPQRELNYRNIEMTEKIGQDNTTPQVDDKNNITGKWKDKDPDQQDTKFDFHQNGENVTGTYSKFIFNTKGKKRVNVSVNGIFKNKKLSFTTNEKYFERISTYTSESFYEMKWNLQLSPDGNQLSGTVDWNIKTIVNPGSHFKTQKYPNVPVVLIRE